MPPYSTLPFNKDLIETPKPNPVRSQALVIWEIKWWLIIGVLSL
jgi:hypothetical protein